MTKPPAQASELTDAEIARRRDEVVKRMLATPPQPRKAVAPAGGEPHCYVLLDGALRVVKGKLAPGVEVTADVYRNLDEMRAGKPVEPGAKLTVRG